MPKATPSFAKNTIRRALRAVVDAEPSRAAIVELWQHFESQCAYCGRLLDGEQREGHIDHLVPTTVGGTNHVSNRVLSCPACNGDEKRESDWLQFLRQKVGDVATLNLRRRKIEAWVASKTPRDVRPIDAGVLQSEIDRVVAAFDSAVKNLRSGNARD